MRTYGTVLLLVLSLIGSVARADAGPGRAGPSIDSSAPEQSAVLIFDSVLMQRFEDRLPAFSADGVPFTERYFAQMGKSTYLVQRGWDAVGNCRSWAVKLPLRSSFKSEEFEIEQPGVEVHSCSGDPCSSCSFVRDGSDKITGCKCGGSGKCNHTITSVPQ